MRDGFSTFIMSETTLNQIKVLPPEIQLKFFWAVANFGTNGIEPDFSGLELAIWIPMRDLIIHSKRKKDEWKQKQSEFGKRGAVKRWAPENGEPINPIPENGEPINPNGVDSLNGNGKGNNNDNDKNNGNKPIFLPGLIQEAREETPVPGDPPGLSPDPPPDAPSQTREDAITVFNKARALWNSREIPPQCRDIIIPPAEYDCLRAFQNYSWPEIENAIKNYHWHKSGKCGEGWAQPPPYGSIYGFLKTGVARYFDDDALESQFRQQEAKYGGRK